ncbi:MAG: beta-eliminating lyase-related protein [Chloroflexota bacterium]
MYRYNFQNDYSEGAAPRILEALTKTNFTQELGYSEDQYCLEAAALIRHSIDNEEADIHFVSGGTQANIIMLSSSLRSFESVIAVESGHICVHETGAIEATGHKINTIKGKEGKVTAAEIEAVVAGHGDEHMVKPRVVFISHSSEVGTIYTAKELREIAATCKKLNLYLYLDGARLGSALTSKAADLTIKELSSLVDAFYIGGTKNGALLGEVMVINNPLLKPDFRYHIKQKGGLLSKGRVLGIQFLELFKDNLYFDLARHANAMAERLTHGITDLGYSFQTNSPTNQIFPILPNKVIHELSHHYRFYVWAKVDDEQSSIRLVTSWATREDAVDEFVKDLAGLTSM